ncbi:hypothetical protein [Microbacterium sp. SORGH_AS_0862]|uniref:hypothetical protein n=1 Tax=Microbacterium sp. SORGH_AS_0862 TaxID=3041789 RepID=UPI0027912E76|nr:hypothetical protein [Microbacterium sp. SORGH_AS_0862]MDQ1204432.1 hypothetical protein [Microbacterium sp. SORGH_AS_0862]
MTQQPAPGVDYPGKTLGVVGLVVAIFFNVIGLIISAIAFNQSKKAGYKNTPALVGIIIGAVLFGLGVILWIVAIAAGVAAVNMNSY